MKTSLLSRWRVGVCGLLAVLGMTVATCPAAEQAGQDFSQGGFGKSAPVLAALEKYRRDHGQYPASEKELVPQYLPRDKTYGNYRLTRDGAFALTFGYIRGSLPGLTVWTYYSSQRRWVHTGFY